MKRLFLFLISIMLILLSCSCAREFSFREHHFGDSADQIRDIEGEPDDTITDVEDWESIVYPGVEILDEYEARLVYSFKDNGLQHIIAVGEIDDQLDVTDATNTLKSKLKLGEPDEETDQYEDYKVLWKKGDYAAVLIVSSGSFTLVYGADTDRMEAFYDTLMFTSLYQADFDPEYPGL